MSDAPTPIIHIVQPADHNCLVTVKLIRDIIEPTVITAFFQTAVKLEHYYGLVNSSW